MMFSPLIILITASPLSDWSLTLWQASKMLRLDWSDASASWVWRCHPAPDPHSCALSWRLGDGRCRMCTRNLVFEQILGEKIAASHADTASEPLQTQLAHIQTECFQLVRIRLFVIIRGTRRMPQMIQVHHHDDIPGKDGNWTIDSWARQGNEGRSEGKETTSDTSLIDISFGIIERYWVRFGEHWNDLSRRFFKSHKIGVHHDGMHSTSCKRSKPSHQGTMSHLPRSPSSPSRPTSHGTTGTTDPRARFVEIKTGEWMGMMCSVSFVFLWLYISCWFFLYFVLSFCVV